MEQISQKDSYLSVITGRWKELFRYFLKIIFSLLNLKTMFIFEKELLHNKTEH